MTMQTSNDSGKGDDNAQTSGTQSKETQPEKNTGKKTSSTEEGSDSKQKGGTDYKEKFAASTREAQRLQEEKKQIKAERDKLKAKLEETSEALSEKKLAQKYPGYADKSEDEKKRIKKLEGQEKRIRKMEEKQAWKEDFKSLVSKDQYSDLNGREGEFKSFAYQYPKDVDLETLAKSFLYEKGEIEEGPKQKPEKKSTKGLEKPTGGQKQSPPSELSLQDIKRLRETDHERYIKLLKEGKIEKIPQD